jgi:hypothetical protein
MELSPEKLDGGQTLGRGARQPVRERRIASSLLVKGRDAENPLELEGPH